MLLTDACVCMHCAVVELIQPKETRGFSKFLETRVLKQYLSTDDTLRLECEVEEFAGWRTHVAYGSLQDSCVCSGMGAATGSCADGCAADVHASAAAGFGELLLRSGASAGSGEGADAFDFFADLELECEGTRLRAHRCVLAMRSAVFSAMLRSNLREATERVVHVHDMRLHVLRELLHFMYTGQCSGALSTDANMAAEVLAGADMYAVMGLKHACEVRLVRALHPDSCLTLLQLADMHALPRLRAAAMDCALLHAPSLLMGSAFVELCRAAPELVREIMRALLLPAPSPVPAPAGSTIGSPARHVADTRAKRRRRASLAN